VLLDDTHFILLEHHKVEMFNPLVIVRSHPAHQGVFSHHFTDVLVNEVISECRGGVRMMFIRITSADSRTKVGSSTETEALLLCLNDLDVRILFLLKPI
jgi:hypothetical protein